mmetsp:Transcript_24170/g.72119  ORF Transcript_24170/g.72119 Transcript_24170/m.72119 type:complete len:168 (-) Transcript_24170:580-1083(-)
MCVRVPLMSAEMAGKVGLLAESPIANMAFVLLLTSVDGLVSTHVAPLRERLAAEFTLERPVARVHRSMAVPIAVVAEDLAANVTFVFGFLLPFARLAWSSRLFAASPALCRLGRLLVACGRAFRFRLGAVEDFGMAGVMDDRDAVDGMGVTRSGTGPGGPPEAPSGT